MRISSHIVRLARAREAVSGERHGSGSRLLLVDDAWDIRTIARLSLERVGGWIVVTATSGPDGLRALHEEGPFDVVLLDATMPCMDGPATLARMHAEGLDVGVPVVFLATEPEDADRGRLEELGVAGVLAKPFDPMDLPRELDLVLAAY
jgi:CheY-like chemotaxis protein